MTKNMHLTSLKAVELRSSVTENALPAKVTLKTRRIVSVGRYIDVSLTDANENNLLNA